MHATLAAQAVPLSSQIVTFARSLRSLRPAPFACAPATHMLLSRLADQAAIRPMRCMCVGVSNRTRKYPNNSTATLISAHTHPLNGLLPHATG